jgi:hypothetical protein
MAKALRDALPKKARKFGFADINEESGKCVASSALNNSEDESM